MAVRSAKICGFIMVLFMMMWVPSKSILLHSPGRAPGQRSEGYEDMTHPQRQRRVDSTCFAGVNLRIKVTFLSIFPERILSFIFPEKDRDDVGKTLAGAADQTCG
jgi:hypothetical protein